MTIAKARNSYRGLVSDVQRDMIAFVVGGILAGADPVPLRKIGKNTPLEVGEDGNPIFDAYDTWEKKEIEAAKDREDKNPRDERVCDRAAYWKRVYFGGKQAGGSMATDASRVRKAIKLLKEGEDKTVLSVVNEFLGGIGLDPVAKLEIDLGDKGFPGADDKRSDEEYEAEVRAMNRRFKGAKPIAMGSSGFDNVV